MGYRSMHTGNPRLTPLLLVFFFCSDNIVQGLINAMMNSGDRMQLRTAKTISSK